MAMKIYVVSEEDGCEKHYFLSEERAFEYLKKTVPNNVYKHYGYSSWKKFNEDMDTDYKNKLDYIQDFIMVMGGNEEVAYSYVMAE